MNQWQSTLRWARAQQNARWGVAMLLLTAPLLMATPAQAVDNLAFKGTLVNAPCTLRAGDDNIALDFETVIDKYLYSDTRTPSRTFSLHLDDCDTSVMTGVKLTFTGTESMGLPGLLALDATSVARGVAIGMETAGGQALPLNVQGSTTPLTPGNMVIALRAYVQAEPAAQSSLGIVRGPFTATATFALEYQ
ncbi:fimbrial protein [Serratia fonticola]|uniref:fimbrial protein n=1 Tax=Serratia fonticola TaxID=47917 RepID=UPI0015C62390|nr:fimbrial protein [Serratia fonticola]MBC3379045.1 fimbrial protein [Serratia fonticola]NYA38245.1 fimbrial protein [Serratia fonticola]